MLIDGAVHCCYHRHLRRKEQAKENCAPEVLRMWVGCCAVQAHCSPADGYCPSPEALPDVVALKEPGAMWVPESGA